MAHGYAKNGKTTKVRRPDFHLFHPGRHGTPTAFSCWRPSFQLSQFWTPVTSRCGVQFHPILYSGRHAHRFLASILPTFSILDATHFHTWRPTPSHPQFWTPRYPHGVLLLASILSALSLLKPFNASENSNRSSTS